ncbi:MAG: glycosyltransferase family 9 protein [Bryobacterales bacterium]|nr:glycosyltransferase family 9 protein [Bryobacteraceae bacterium]MDW8131745.1 glycosyltransferase family 9 protein [Bryobacterales bacterium]
MRRLVIRPGGIGDCLLALPAIEALRCDYLEVWVARQNVPLVRFAHRVQAIQDTGLDWLGLPDREPPAPVIERLGAFDSIVSWYGTNRADFREAVARFRLPFQFLEALPAAPGIHAADFFLRQVGRADLAGFPQLDCPRWDGGFAVIHPFSGSPRKNWPLENFHALARWLGHRLPVRWCAGPEEPLEGAVRFENLYELACWLAGASIYIGNDSGITHLAAAAGAPVVAIFLATDPTVWAPRGARVRVVEGGAIEDVMAAVVSLLASERPHG